MENIHTNTNGGSERDIPQGERELAGKWNKRIKSAKRAAEDRRKKLKALRGYVNGSQHEDGAPGLVRTNLIFSTLQTLLPYIYAKNPDIACNPTEAVSMEQYGVIRRFGKTLEVVLRRLFVVDGHLKKRAKSNLRAAMTTGIGWVKLTYQRDYQRDPLIQNRMNDVQDNIARIRKLGRDLEEGQSADSGATREELELQLKALEEKAKIVAAEGIVLDRIQSEDMLVLDDAIVDFDMYVQARALAHGVWFSKEAYAEQFGADAPRGTTSYRQPAEQNDGEGGSATENGTEYVRVWEIWDRASQTVYTVTEGAPGFCRPPYQPDKLGARWYPFFALAFNLVDGQFQPLSDVELLQELQDEYNTTRTHFAEHRRENIPGLVVRKGGQLTENDIDRIVNRRINEVIVVEGDGNRPLAEDLQQIQGAALDPATYDVSPIRNDMDMVAGLSDASRSNLIQAKTATEAEIMRQGLMSRTAERQDACEDWMLEMAQYAAEVLLQELSTAQVERVAGKGCVWPALSRHEIFDLVRLEIRAGSTGRPNKEQEREQWLQFLPELQQAVTQIATLRAQGQESTANALVEILKETLRRFDERLDVETFIPREVAAAHVPVEPPAVPHAGAAPMAQSEPMTAAHSAGTF